MKTVGEVSALSGVTIRTLHHYDEIGLLSPSERSDAGYRLYAAADLERLQEILGWRALGFSLEEIGSLLGDPEHDRIAALRAQSELIAAERARLAAIAAVIDDALAAHDTGSAIKEAAMFKGFHDAHRQEAHDRWGDTESYREAQRRTASYGRDEWRQIHAEAREIEEQLAALMAAGEPADGVAAREAAEQQRLHLERWFYPCSPQMHAQLGEMYASDPRFTARYDSRAPGLAQYLRAAIAANAEAAPAA
jgi:MerR family transcriptional regulator, thiopeptide resistance regulator